MRKSLLLVVQFVSIFVLFFIISGQNKLPDGFDLYSLMPLSFFGGTFFIYKNFFSSTMKFPITNIGILLMFFLRMVLSPLLSIISGWYVEAVYAPMIEGNLNISILLICYECILSFLVLGWLSSSTNRKNIDREKLISLSGNKLFYLLFILLGILVFIKWGRTGIISFGVLTSNAGERIGDNSNQFYNLVIQIIKITCSLIFFFCLSFLQKRYNKRNGKIFAILAILLAIINTSVIVGERRTIMLFTAISSFLLVIAIFRKYRFQVFVWGILSTMVLIGLASFYKMYFANRFGSYSDAISNTNFSLTDIAQNLQAYFTGPQNVSLAIRMKQSHNPNIFNLLFDFARSTFGFSFLVKSSNFRLTSGLFNSIFYSSDNYSSGHILSSIGYGYYYLGPILAPVFTIIHINFATFIEKILNRSSSYESIYFLSYILSRVVFNIYYSTPSLIVFVTQNIFTFGLVLVVGNLISGKGKIKLNESSNIF